MTAKRTLVMFTGALLGLNVSYLLFGNYLFNLVLWMLAFMAFVTLYPFLKQLGIKMGITSVIGWLFLGVLSPFIAGISVLMVSVSIVIRVTTMAFNKKRIATLFNSLRNLKSLLESDI